MYKDRQIVLLGEKRSMFVSDHVEYPFRWLRAHGKRAISEDATARYLVVPAHYDVRRHRYTSGSRIIGRFDDRLHAEQYAEHVDERHKGKECTVTPTKKGSAYRTFASMSIRPERDWFEWIGFHDPNGNWPPKHPEWVDLEDWLFNGYPYKGW